MKGIILAGGSGTRLQPLTFATNKHLLPVYDKPVVYYAVEKLVNAGVTKIMLVTNPHHVDSFVKLLGSGQRFVPKESPAKQIQIVYGIQNEPNGIAYGLYIAKDYVGSEDCVLYLGDNIFMDDISSAIRNFKGGATVFLKKVSDPHRFGIAQLGKDSQVISIEEKPKRPKSNYAVTGLYIYDNTAFDKFLKQPISPRGEYEITDLNNAYVAEGTLRAHILKKQWYDIGTIKSLHEAATFMRKKNKS
ncbi:MAG: glucose-phosphate thymidylyltransferase, glucose-phosphate thymidylyltransferase [Candidatus Parcubacteria bacterium]|jgi:glucose-1-phosphate thymidylyltransferase